MINIGKDCQEVYDFLIDYQEKNLSLFERLKFKAHLLWCSQCAHYLKIYNHSSDIFRKALQEDPPPQSLMDLTSKFLENRRGDKPGSGDN